MVNWPIWLDFMSAILIAWDLAQFSWQSLTFILYFQSHPSIFLTPHYQEAFPSLDGDEITEKFKGLLLVSVGAKNNLHLCYGIIYILLNNSTKHLLAPDKDGSLVIILCIRKY